MDERPRKHYRRNYSAEPVFRNRDKWLKHGYSGSRPPSIQLSPHAANPLTEPAQALLSQQVSGRAISSRSGAAIRLPLDVGPGGREQCNPDYLVDRDAYAYYVIEYVAEGAGEATLDGVRNTLEAGTVLRIRRGRIAGSGPIRSGRC